MSKGIVTAVEVASALPTQLTTGWLVAVEERAHRLHGYIGGEDEEAGRDQLLRSSFSALRLHSAPGEEPDDDETGHGLDERVCSEPTSAIDPAASTAARANRELDYVPGDAAPRELPSSPLGAQTLMVPAYGDIDQALTRIDRSRYIQICRYE